MKKILAVIAAALLLAAFAAPVLAASDWNSMVADMQKREKIKETGAAVLQNIRELEPSGSEKELWSMLWSGEPKWRAAAALALVDRMFPGGDPSKWEQVTGFIGKGSRQPRQLAAMDGLFVAVEEMRKLPDGVWGSALLLSQFGRSGMGKVQFIDELPAGMREVLDDVIAQTGLPGDWSSKRVRGRLPLLPVYNGFITRDAADSRQMQYLDGFGSISGNGRYAWDRDRGYIYEVIEESDWRSDIWIDL
jgi:hypothetical protein